MNLIDVSTWVEDEQNRVFPVGARDKGMLWSPKDNLPVGVKSQWPYMFKESIRYYPDQFWTEIVAYIVSKYLAVDVPVTFPAIKNDGENIKFGALSEWFYDVKDQRFIHGGQYFKQLNPDFDDKLGTQHNLHDFLVICRAMRKYNKLKDNILEWLADMALFDCLIGNTDRHQENWGIIFNIDGTSLLSPLFDNGTSLGHERFPEKIKNWDQNKFISYLSRGQHHLRYNRKEPQNRIKHFDFIKLLSEDFETHNYISDKINKLNATNLINEVYILTRAC